MLGFLRLPLEQQTCIFGEVSHADATAARPRLPAEII